MPPLSFRGLTTESAASRLFPIGKDCMCAIAHAESMRYRFFIRTDSGVKRRNDRLLWYQICVLFVWYTISIGKTDCGKGRGCGREKTGLVGAPVFFSSTGPAVFALYVVLTGYSAMLSGRCF